MRISIKWNLCTDGDFALRNYEKYNCIEFDGYEDYFGMQEFEDENETHCAIEASRYLKQMLCDIHVGYNHYYLLSDLYNLFKPLIDFAYKGKIGQKTECLYGNYNGTEITVTIEKIE